MRGMSLQARATLLLAVLAAALGVAAAIAIDALHQERMRRADVRDRAQPAADVARLLLVFLVDQETGERGFVITGRADFLEPYTSGRRSTGRALTRIATLTRNEPELRPALTTVRRRYAEWLGLVSPEIDARAAGRAERAIQLVADGRSKVSFDVLRVAVAELQAKIDAVVRNANDGARAAANRVRTTLLAVGGVLAMLVLAGTLLTRRWVLVPLRRLAATMRKVGAGDLALRIVPSGPPEIAAVGRDAEGMRRRILDELERAQGAVEALEQRGPVVTGLRSQLSASATEPPVGLSAAGALHSAEGVLAGDWYDLVALEDGRFGLLIVDVSGHGAGAGLIALRLKHVLTTAMRHGTSPERALALAAEPFDGDVDGFATCAIAIADPLEGTLRWANAGHPPPLLVRGGKVLRTLTATGPVLSALGGEWESALVEWPADATVVAYTDGLTEARRPGGDLFGEARLRAALEQLASDDPQEIVDALLAEARDHAGGRPRDDLTVVAIRREGVSPRSRSSSEPAGRSPAR